MSEEMSKRLVERVESFKGGKLNEWEIETLEGWTPIIQRALKANKIYARVETVARSGMSRTIRLSIVHKGEIVNLNNTVFAFIYSDSVKRGWGARVVRIGGCGMDMLFEANYRLFKALLPKTAYQPYCRYLNG